MNFTVKQADIIQELNMVRGSVSSVTTVPILSHVLLVAEEGRLKIAASDIEIGIDTSCPATIIKAGKIAIPAKRLLDYVALFPPEAELTFALQDNDWVKITCGKARGKLPSLPAESFPSAPEPLPAMAEIPSSVLSQAISSVIFAVARSAHRLTLNGALMDGRETSCTFVGTDEKRMAVRTFPIEALSNMRVLIPVKAALELTRLLSNYEGPVKFSENEQCLFFSLGERVLTARKLSGSFPDYTRALPQDAPVCAVINSPEFQRSLARCSQFCETNVDGRFKKVTLKLTPGALSISAGQSEDGVDEIPAEYTGPDIETTLNGTQVMDFLRMCPGDVVLIVRGKTDSAEMRMAGEGDSYRYIIAPIR